jgi:SAM-dependent methyltransferase
MAWRTTEEAPPRAWAWPESVGMYEEERAACVAVDRILRAQTGAGLAGRTVLELGCGRGACLRYAREHLSAGPLIGVDRAEGAIEAATRALADLPDVRIVRAEATATGLPGGCADVVWSHGVVEHFRPDELGAYIREALRLAGGGYVAFSAPNPGAPAYAAFRALLLAEERWEWGYEEPLASYAPAVVAAGGTVLFDGTVGRKMKHAHPYARLLPEGEQNAIRARIAAGTEPGIYTLVIARGGGPPPEVPVGPEDEPRT